MKNQLATLLVTLIWAIAPVSNLLAHPTGNMITVGDHVLWAYINPLDDPDHHACIMIRDGHSEPRVFLRSEYPASDFMLYHQQDDIYIIERRHRSASQSFEFRILKTTVESEPVVIWDWSKDEWRIGEGGFFMRSDTHVVFGRYPEIYSLKKGGYPEKYLEFSYAVNRIREVEGRNLLILSDSTCHLLGQNGEVLHVWKNLIDNSIDEAPLGRNQIFDADYHQGKLLLAYWGKRSFELIDQAGNRNTILQQSDPLTPHWVAFKDHDLLLFSSKLIWDGSTPKPYLVLHKGPQDQTVVWGTP